MQALQTLIDKASEMCGGPNALARKLGVSKTLLSLMRSGQRKITPITAVKLANITGDDLDIVLRAATMVSAEGTADESLIREILGKALVAGGAAMSGFSYSADLTTSSGSQTTTTKNESAGAIDSVTNATKLFLYCRFLGIFRAGKTLIRWAGNRLRSESHPPQAGPQTAV